MMMAVVNIGSEYRRPTTVLKQVSGIVPTIPHYRNLVPPPSEKSERTATERTLTLKRRILRWVSWPMGLPHRH